MGKAVRSLRLLGVGGSPLGHNPANRKPPLAEPRLACFVGKKVAHMAKSLNATPISCMPQRNYTLTVSTNVL